MALIVNINRDSNRKKGRNEERDREKTKMAAIKDKKKTTVIICRTFLKRSKFNIFMLVESYFERKGIIFFLPAP